MSFRKEKAKREKNLVSQFTFRCRIFVEEKVSKGKKLRERKKLLISQFMFRRKNLVEERVSDSKKLTENKMLLISQFTFHNRYYSPRLLLRKNEICCFLNFFS